jgi:hypothetical protein
MILTLKSLLTTSSTLEARKFRMLHRHKETSVIYLSEVKMQEKILRANPGLVNRYGLITSTLMLKNSGAVFI